VFTTGEVDKRRFGHRFADWDGELPRRIRLGFWAGRRNSQNCRTRCLVFADGKAAAVVGQLVKFAERNVLAIVGFENDRLVPIQPKQLLERVNRCRRFTRKCGRVANDAGADGQGLEGFEKELGHLMQCKKVLQCRSPSRA
jgi:hypothetical protein